MALVVCITFYSSDIEHLYVFLICSSIFYLSDSTAPYILVYLRVVTANDMEQPLSYLVSAAVEGVVFGLSL